MHSHWTLDKEFFQRAPFCVFVVCVQNVSVFFYSFGFFVLLLWMFFLVVVSAGSVYIYLREWSNGLVKISFTDTSTVVSEIGIEI
jgi:hypothetical protein